jgi:glycosyltransferase involved in cell wall biosynthesis
MSSTSVIVPCRDAAAFLADCLTSCLDDPDVREVIVVDDGSRDGSALIAEAWARRSRGRIRLVEQPATGVNPARNRGLEEATGDLVLWFDADDYLLPGGLAPLRAALAADPGLDVVCGDFRIRRDDLPGAPIGPVITRPRTGDVLEDLLADAWRPTGAFLMRASLARRLSWDPTVTVGTDRAYWFAAALAGARFGHVAGEVMIYRRHGPSISTRDPLRRIVTHLEHLDALDRELDARGLWTASRRAAAAYTRVVLARDLVRLGMPERARQVLAAVGWRQLGGYRRRFSTAARLVAATAGLRAAVWLAVSARSYTAT